VARVVVKDLQSVVRFLGSAVAGSPDEPVPVSTLVALQGLIGAEGACYFELRRTDRAVLAYTTTPGDPDAPGTEEARERFAHQNPIRWRRWLPADGSLRFSSMVTRRQRDRLEFYRYYLEPNGVRDTIKVWLSSSPESASCVLLERASTDFTDREQSLLGILQQHLIQMRAQALSGMSARTAPEHPLTVREAEILTWAARGLADDAIAAMLGVSPATVGKHLEHAFEKLGVHSRAEALWRLGSGPSSTSPT
jgi:DNA-binding CsgD family transcriptional regulator